MTRTAGGYNAYTGNQWKTQMGQSYNSTTGQLSSGQRAGVKNVYTGSTRGCGQGRRRTRARAHRRRVVRRFRGTRNTGNYQVNTKAGGYNPNTGTVGAGQKTTVGNTHTGQSATAASGTIGNTNTGQSVDYRGVKTDQGTGVGQVGNTTVREGPERRWFTPDRTATSTARMRRAAGRSIDPGTGSRNPRTANTSRATCRRRRRRARPVSRRTQNYQATQKSAQNYQANYGTQNRRSADLHEHQHSASKHQCTASGAFWWWRRRPRWRCGRR